MECVDFTDQAMCLTTCGWMYAGVFAYHWNIGVVVVGFTCHVHWAR